MDLCVARIRVRKSFQGNVLEEEVLEILPDDPAVMLSEIGQIYARKLAADPEFEKLCTKQNDTEQKAG